MRVLVDTCVWSRALRAQEPDVAIASKLRDLVLDHRVVLMGPILQEVLSGLKNKKDFFRLREYLATFDDLFLFEEIYVKAAEYFNLCRQRGLNGGHIDFLICAAVVHYNCVLWTVDHDFKMISRHVPLKLL